MNIFSDILFSKPTSQVVAEEELEELRRRREEEKQQRAEQEQQRRAKNLYVQSRPSLSDQSTNKQYFPAPATDENPVGLLNWQGLEGFGVPASTPFSMDRDSPSLAQGTPGGNTLLGQQGDWNQRRRALLNMADPDAAFQAAVDRDYPPPTVQEQFKPVNMQRPGTNNMRLARTQEEYNALANQGFVNAGNSVPGAAPPQENKDFGNEGALRGQFMGHPITKNFIALNDASQKIGTSLKADTAAGDMAAIFAFMKILDPGSTVREGEYANAESARGVPEAIFNLYNRAIAGTKLTPDQRLDFGARATEMAGVAGKSFGQNFDYYSNLATQYNLNPQNVVIDYRLAPETQEGPPTQVPVPGQGQPPPGGGVLDVGQSTMIGGVKVTRIE